MIFPCALSRSMTKQSRLSSHAGHPHLRMILARPDPSRLGGLPAEPSMVQFIIVVTGADRGKAR